MSYDISLCASAIRIQDWRSFYKSTQQNNCKVEIVFVGDVMPNFDLPDNFRFIYAPVKPAQCWEAALRTASGRYISLTADDAEYTPGSLDKMVQFMDSRFNIKIVGSFQTIENGHLITSDHQYKGKLMAPFFVFKKCYYYYIGGADQRFIGGMFENDIIMRVHEDGGKVEICPDAYVSVDHLKKHNGTSPQNECHFTHSFPLFESLWVDADKRTDKLQPFDNKDLTRISQGERGKW
jgi:hypothetical protein